MRLLNKNQKLIALRTYPAFRYSNSKHVYTYSKILSINENEYENTKRSIYPNPATNYILLKFKSDNYSKSDIMIYNLLGIKQVEMNLELNVSKNSIPIVIWAFQVVFILLLLVLTMKLNEGCLLKSD